MSDQDQRDRRSKCEDAKEDLQQVRENLNALRDDRRKINTKLFQFKAFEQRLEAKVDEMREGGE